MAKPLVFSFVNEQRRFLFLLLGFLTFLSILSGGVILSLSSAVARFSSGLEKTGLIMVMPGANLDAAKKILEAQKDNIVSARTIDREESSRLLQNWLSGSNTLANHIPTVIQVRAKTTKALDKIANDAAAAKLRFAHGRNAAPDRRVGFRIMTLAGFIFMTILGALGVCIAHSVRNIITIHKREIEIMHQVGSTNNYIAWQIQKAMLEISAKAMAGGWLAGAAMLVLINGLARGARVGLLGQMGMNLTDWMMTIIMAAALVILTVWITRNRAMKILAK